MNMYVLICQSLSDGSVKDKSIHRSEQIEENMLMLLVIGSLSTLLC